jgi:hypothetical protein
VKVDEILLLTNGPGELLTWVVPVLARLRGSGARIELFLIRDQFAAGTEQARAKELGLDVIWGMPELLRRVAQSKKSEKRGVVLMLGGNPSQAVLLGRALGYPTYAYSFDPKSWRPGLSQLLVDSPRTQKAALARGADAARVQVVGNLVLDAFADASNNAVEPAEVLLFPSSRPFAARYLIGYMLAIAESMAQKTPQLRFAWAKSSLLDEQTVREGLEAKASREIGGVAARLTRHGLVTEHGLHVRILDEQERYAAMHQAQVAITVPGTNTLELAMAGLPSVVLLPLHKPELLPLEGILHWLFMLPGGRRFKQAFVHNLVNKLAYLALPNQWLGEQVFPEMRGIFTPDQVAAQALQLLEPTAQQRIKAKLNTLDIQPGAGNLVDFVLS